MIVSICGKGGSGKSIVVSLMAFEAQKRGLKVLVVDSDESNSGLYRFLGLDSPPYALMDFLGGKQELKDRMKGKNILREESISYDSLPADYVSQRENIKLVSIGKINQAQEGCACPMGVLNREFLKKLDLKEGQLAIVDMEAGVEHFGRGIDSYVNLVLLIVEPSLESIQLAERIQNLAFGIGKRVWAVLNKVRSEEVGQELAEEIKRRGIQIAGIIPEDPSLFQAALKGKSLENSGVSREVSSIFDSLVPRA